MTDKQLSILFFGDLVGRPGRLAVKGYLAKLKAEGKLPDLVIANAENTSHGFGFSKAQYDELMAAGVQVFTGGNHLWDRKDIFEYIDKADALIRPANFPANSPGVGHRVITITQKDGTPLKVGIINLIGQVFMGSYNSPWEALDNCINDVLSQTPIVFLDLHAEATAEKVAIGHYAAQKGVKAMVGTHTHVQTADGRVIKSPDGKNAMGYITDAGFNGGYDSIIGMAIEGSVNRLRTGLPTRLEVSDSDRLQINAVCFTLELPSGKCLKVENIFEQTDKATCEHWLSRTVFPALH